jgi:DNA-binding response OmpR family regulator
MTKDNLHILIVEDDSFLSKTLTRQLEKMSMQVTHVKNGEDALLAMRSENFDMVLLDVILPKKNGFEVLEEVSKDEKLQDIKIVVMSNIGSPADMESAISMGALDYFVKTDTSLFSMVQMIEHYIK